MGRRERFTRSYSSSRRRGGPASRREGIPALLRLGSRRGAQRGRSARAARDARLLRGDHRPALHGPLELGRLHDREPRAHVQPEGPGRRDDWLLPPRGRGAGAPAGRGRLRAEARAALGARPPRAGLGRRELILFWGALRRAPQVPPPLRRSEFGSAARSLLVTLWHENKVG